MNSLSGLSLPQGVLKTFRRRLTNLSSRNRSLLLTTLPASQFMDLHATDHVLGKSSFSIVTDLIRQRAMISLCDVLDPRQERSNQLSQQIRRIQRTAQFISDERGTDDLYVGWPFVRGKFLDDTVIHAPLLFFPVSIEQAGKTWQLIRRGDESVFFNSTLALAYGQFNQIRLEEEFINPSFESFDRDPLTFRTQLYEWLKASPFDINFNQDLFTDQLVIFDQLNRKGLDQLERIGELKLYPEAVLGIFPQAGSFLVPDYDELIEEARRKGEKEEENLESEYFLAPSDPPSIPERLIHTPLPMDASQEVALRSVKAGRSIVVQGPPGTGKSQLIANLMADAAATGKRVLLVCQKRAALDVVQARLQQVGMAPFMALIHDFQDDRRSLYDQIAGQVDQLDVYKQQNNSLNAVLLERDFDVESRQIDKTVAALQAFKQALFDSTECGASIKELYLTSDPEASSIPLDDQYWQFRLTEIEPFVRRLSDYSAYQQRLGSTHVWHDRVSFASFTVSDQSKIDQALTAWTQLAHLALEQTNKLIGRSFTLKELKQWLDFQSVIRQLSTLLSVTSQRVWDIVQQLRHQPNHPALADNSIQLDLLADQWKSALNSPGPATGIALAEVDRFRAVLSDAQRVREEWLQWNWWLMTNAERNWLRQLVSANKLTLSATDLHTLYIQLDKREQLDSIHQRAAPLFSNLSLPHEPDSLRIVQQAIKLAQLIGSITIPYQLPESVWQSAAQFGYVLERLLYIAEQVDLQQNQLYLTHTQRELLWQNPSSLAALRQSLKTDFDLMVESDRLHTQFSTAELGVVNRLSIFPHTSWLTVFQNSLRLAWINHLEQKEPELRSVSTLRITQSEQALQTSIQRKQALSRDILLMKLREQTYRNLTINRLNNVITYRDLHHQTTKKRNVWPIRKLLSAFSDEIFKLIPCWLASPESVSAIFPLRADLFDLVIFDEASQCFAENGVPAIARAKQVVITGDSQQLQPSDLYQTRLDEPVPDDELASALEVLSLLNLATQRLPQLLLTEHYRSRSLDLITFSNQYFYRNKLNLLPYFEDVNQYQPAIRYQNVGGVWHQNTNTPEAIAVVNMLKQLHQEMPAFSVGVVTFNYAQQQLIQDLLEENSSLFAIPQLFVKNIENVQGDERDIIIFSVGYAPDSKGRLSMQFGSLNVSGGGNRLNVAVTRARERIYVITSLWPEQLQVDASANDGPKLLKAYLAYALAVDQGYFKPVIANTSPLSAATLLKTKLSHRHPDWLPELPFADLVEKQRDQYKSLILTDDDAYYEQTIKQAHAYLPLSLHQRNWPFQRVWSREYWRRYLKQ
ncbi:AAA domain-containing protein [Spirosoma pomorum]